MNKKKLKQQLNDWITYSKAIKLVDTYPYKFYAWVEAGLITKIEHSGVTLYYKPEVVETAKTVKNLKENRK